MKSLSTVHPQNTRASLGSLAIFGRPRAVADVESDQFTWPVVTPEDEGAIRDVLRKGKVSGIDVTMEFEREFSAWLGTEFALEHNTGTAALHAAMFAVGLGRCDELICPTLTSWASCL